MKGPFRWPVASDCPLGLFLLALLCAGCAMPVQTRTADVLPPGTMRLGGGIGGSFGPSKLPDAIPPEYMANWFVSTRLGVAPRVEVMADLGWSRQVLAGRFDVLNAGRGEWVSMAAMAQVSGKPILVPDGESATSNLYEWDYGGEVGGGIDVSVPLWGVVEPLLSLSASYGHQWYHVPKPNPERLHPEQSKYQMRTRLETRLEATFGFAVNLVDEEGAPQIILGVSPYWVTLSPDVPGNGDGEPDGVTFTLGGSGLFSLWGP